MIYDSVEQFTDLYFVFTGSPDPTHRNKCSDGWLHFFSFFDFQLQSLSQICNRSWARHGSRAGKMKKKLLYETPVVEVLDARVEKGFAGSGDGTGNPDNTPGTQPLDEGYYYYL